MSEPNHSSSIVSTSDIRIVGLNADKTRKTSGSETQYQVYFELSGAPARAWRSIFEREWKAFNLARPKLWQEAVIDMGFLVMHCTLQETARYLPVLKNAVTATNTAHGQYVQEQAAEQEHEDDVRKQERIAVGVMAGKLHFE